MSFVLGLKRIIFSLAIFFISASLVCADDKKMLSESQSSSSQAESLVAKFAPALYQVEAVSSDSNKRNSIGSGFQISKDGYIVTNYHVISSVVLNPEVYSLRTIQPGREYPAKVVSFDIIHDLAIIKITPQQEVFFSLGSSNINKGKTIYSIGNPQDLGMVIKEGLASGYMEKALYQKMLTSLSLNPGMSGGPSLDEWGKVVGINVATAGSALSFLVPVEFLKDLVQKVQDKDEKSPGKFTDDIQEQLIRQEKVHFKTLLAKEWERQQFGDFKVPAAISKEVDCWGAPSTDTEAWLNESTLACSSKDAIFVSRSINAQSVFFNYTWLSSPEYDPIRLYALANMQFKQYRLDLEEAQPQDVENFQCRTDLTTIAEHPFWVSTCARKLKKFPRLYDINILFGSLGEMKSVLAVELTLGAITRDTAKDFINKFMREMEWVR